MSQWETAAYSGRQQQTVGDSSRWWDGSRQEIGGDSMRQESVGDRRQLDSKRQETSGDSWRLQGTGADSRDSSK